MKREDINVALAAYWGQVFAASTCKAAELRQQWLQETVEQAEGLGEGPIWDDSFFGKAVDLSGNSAPGPDGRPYAAFRHSRRPAASC